MPAPTNPVNHSFFFFNDTATTEIYTLSLHDALPICNIDLAWDDPLHVARLSRLAAFSRIILFDRRGTGVSDRMIRRSEEHTSELQSHLNLVCRLLLEKKNTAKQAQTTNLITLDCTYT